MRRPSPGVLLAVALLGCGADAFTSDVSGYAGDYTLISINGTALPFSLANTATLSLIETSETFTLSAAGTFIDVTHYQRTQNSVTDYPTDTLQGNFTVRGQTANFTTTKGDLLTGTMGTSAFTLQGSSTIYFYRKQ